jgi:drug/metabolite transporter (DMT)-like permease
MSVLASSGGESGAPVWATLAALGAASTWAVGILCFQRAFRGGAGERVAPSPAAANLLKNALACALFALVAWLVHARWPPADAWPMLLTSGAFGFALGDGLYFAALAHVGAQRTAMLVQLNVPVSAVSSAVLYGERFPPVLLAAMAVVVAGILIVVRADDVPALGDTAAHRSRRLGIACALGAVLFQSAGTVAGHGSMQDLDVLGAMVVRILGGVLGSFAVVPLGALLAGGEPRRELARLVAPLSTPAHWRALAVATLFGALLSLPLFHYALRELDTGLGMVLFSTTPLFTLPFSALVGERHGARAWWGTALGFAGVVGVVWLQHAGGAPGA